MDAGKIRWHVLTVEGGRELAVAEDLLKRGHDAYAPMETIWVAPRKPGLRPLFPGYVFAAVDPDAAERQAAARRQGEAFAWRERLLSAMASIEARPGVVGFVRFGSDVATVPADVVETLRAAETRCAFDRTQRTYRRASRFAPGQAVRFANGPWCGLTAVVERAAGERVRLLLEILGRASRIEAAASVLEPA